MGNVIENVSFDGKHIASLLEINTTMPKIDIRRRFIKEHREWKDNQKISLGITIGGLAVMLAADTAWLYFIWKIDFLFFLMNMVILAITVYAIYRWDHNEFQLAYVNESELMDIHFTKVEISSDDRVNNMNDAIKKVKIFYKAGPNEIKNISFYYNMEYDDNCNHFELDLDNRTLLVPNNFPQEDEEEETEEE